MTFAETGSERLLDTIVWQLRTHHCIFDMGLLPSPTTYSCKDLTRSFDATDKDIYNKLCSQNTKYKQWQTVEQNRIKNRITIHNNHLIWAIKLLSHTDRLKNHTGIYGKLITIQQTTIRINAKYLTVKRERNETRFRNLSKAK